MTFPQHSACVNFLLHAMRRDPPPGYSKPSLHQVILCDKAAFTRLASTMASVRQRPDNTFPLGENLLKLRSDPTIVLHLTPLAKAALSQTSAPRSSPYPSSAQRPAQSFGGDKKPCPAYNTMVGALRECGCVLQRLTHVHDRKRSAQMDKNRSFF